MLPKKRDYKKVVETHLGKDHSIYENFLGHLSSPETSGRNTATVTEGFSVAPLTLPDLLLEWTDNQSAEEALVKVSPTKKPRKRSRPKSKSSRRKSKSKKR
jgi:hypothetical protein